MIVTYVLSYLLLLLLHMHATASHEQKVCLGLGFLFGVFSLFSFCFLLYLPAPEIPSFFSSRLILSATIFRALWFLLFLCACFFSRRLELRHLGKVRGVCYGVVGGLDIVENHGLHGVGLGHFMIDITITHYFQLDELTSISTI